MPSSFTEANDRESNNLVEVKSGRVLGPINAPTAYARMNHSELLPAWWSADNAFVFWQVAGKWGMDTQFLVHLKDGEIAWELNVLEELQRAILTRTEADNPKKFLAVKKENWGNGAAYPEKFTIDAKAHSANEGPLKFPLRFSVYLTSNPKGAAVLATGEPEIDSFMEATLEEDGEIEITAFHMGKSPSSPYTERQGAGR